MPNLTRTKRKLEVQTNVRDNKVLKVKGTDGTDVNSKKDLNVQLKSLNEKYDALVVEHSKNLERNKHLTEKVKMLENDNLPKSTASIECQTRSEANSEILVNYWSANLRAGS